MSPHRHRAASLLAWDGFTHVLFQRLESDVSMVSIGTQRVDGEKGFKQIPLNNLSALQCDHQCQLLNYFMLNKRPFTVQGRHCQTITLFH